LIHINQFTTPAFKEIKAEAIVSMKREQIIWGTGDKYWKLAQKFYGDPKYWWVIAWYNQKPTEAHVELGDIIFVPLPLERILTIWFSNNI
jgi:nucleoid-associated protein YgaU